MSDYVILDREEALRSARCHLGHPAVVDDYPMSEIRRTISALSYGYGATGTYDTTAVSDLIGALGDLLPELRKETRGR